MSNKSISDIAYYIIKKSAVEKSGKRAGKHVAHTKELWADVAKELNYSKDQFEKFIGNFFTTLIRDSRFVYLDYQKENEIGVWGLKEEYSFEEFNKFQNPWWGKNQAKKYGESEEDLAEDSVIDEDIEKILEDESEVVTDHSFEKTSKTKVGIDEDMKNEESDDEALHADEEDLELHETSDLIEDEEIIEGLEEEIEIEEEFDELYEEDDKPKKGKKSKEI